MSKVVPEKSIISISFPLEEEYEPGCLVQSLLNITGTVLLKIFKNLIRQPLFLIFTYIQYFTNKVKQNSIFNQEWFMFWKFFKLSAIVFWHITHARNKCLLKTWFQLRNQFQGNFLSNKVKMDILTDQLIICILYLPFFLWRQ